MSALQRFYSRIRALFRKGKLEKDMAEEMRLHIEHQTRENIADGMSPEEAGYAAQRRFGGLDQIKERVRDQRSVLWIEHMGQDLNFTLRQLRKAPGFATTAVLTVAIGIGACAAIFSVVNGVLLHPLDYTRPQRIVIVTEAQPSRFSSILATAGDYLDWTKQASSFDQLAATYVHTYTSMAMGTAMAIQARSVTANFFSVIGIRPMIGRTFLPEEEVPGKDRVAILSYPLWRDQFGGRNDVINETIRLDNQAFTIVGVLPDVPDLVAHAVVITPVAFSAAADKDYNSHFLWVYGLLKPGVSVGRAQSEIDVINGRIDRQHPDSNKGRTAHLTPILESLTGNVRLQLLVLLGAVGFLLLIACVNVASLLLARANSRQKEIAVRTALGASRGRIVRQFLCESLLIGVAGGALGTMIAYGSMGPLVRFASHMVGRLYYVSLSGPVLTFTFGLMLLAGLGFGLIPALQATRGDMVESLKESGRGSSGGRKRQHVRAALVVAEIALALMLLAAAGLLVRTLTAMQQSNEGFKTADVSIESFGLNNGGIAYSPQKMVTFVNEGLERISALPDVRSIAFTTGLPGGLSPGGLLFATPSMSQVAPNALPQTDVSAITSDYFKLLSIPLFHGREFSAQDTLGSPPVIIINQELANKYFPQGSPIGRRIMILNPDNSPDIWREIVGVVGDVKPSGPQSVIGPQVYEPFAQNPAQFMTLVVRAKGPGLTLSSEIRDIFHSLDPNVPFPTIYPYDETIASSWARQRFSTVLFTLFSGAALLLAAIGIYGVMAYSVNQRTNEIGIRMALGAQPGNILQLILASGAKIVGVGLLIGMAGSLAFTRLLGSLLFSTSPNDPLTLIAVAMLLALVAFLACWFPAFRATKVDPVVALRAE